MNRVRSTVPPPDVRPEPIPGGDPLPQPEPEPVPPVQPPHPPVPQPAPGHPPAPPTVPGPSGTLAGIGNPRRTAPAGDAGTVVRGSA